ncbi:hypothetical protein FHX82_000634 [Amycolatopsis bartoniae]|uniref:Uncharacterized protein n=1 Tax=Amycolatopsis bartoniae TaxID=941986 RepID=A0A8H9MFM8_9PSEU|nr:hypothetical protein [Amycolatopsis bartoniae]MBB2933614.1 hypothetical protein [Amycolatopsis bartoniae]TVT10789.1 hypothetical protein FNH07_04100 [Amycolatopsis bartoniae]GHF72880.1 hypothetical protein GCM10017566_53480 [Amycolatopsis bartoniae]
MTTTIPQTRVRPVERIAYGVAAVLFLSGLVHLAVLLVSGTTWEGPVSYRKATTFGLSFGLTLATLAWATSFLRMPSRARAVLLGAFTAVSVVEVALVTLQVWRGVPSHFNFETGFDTLVSMTLALGGAVIIVTVLGFTVAALRTTSGLAPSMLLALRCGLVVLVGALVVGALMIADGVTLSRGGDPQLAYTTAGALKPVHAVAMHGILVLPALAWLLRFTPWPERRRTRVVQAAAVAYALAVAGTWVLFG